jgi:hypothetical protein
VTRGGLSRDPAGQGHQAAHGAEVFREHLKPLTCCDASESVECGSNVRTGASRVLACRTSVGGSVLAGSRPGRCVGASAPRPRQVAATAEVHGITAYGYPTGDVSTIFGTRDVWSRTTYIDNALGLTVMN